jgi:hypothetical protein
MKGEASVEARLSLQHVIAMLYARSLLGITVGALPPISYMTSNISITHNIIYLYFNHCCPIFLYRNEDCRISVLIIVKMI